MNVNLRKGYELNWLFLNRRVRPFHLAVTIATGAVGWHLAFYPHNDPWSGWTAHALGGAALAAAVCLTIGWWWRSDWFAEAGLLIAVGVWVARAMFVILDGNEAGLLSNPWLSALLSVAWAVGAGGAYLLERMDHQIGAGGRE